jgi:lipoprotein-anchoring transpeptidase ErfK/SrfK
METTGQNAYELEGEVVRKEAMLAGGAAPERTPAKRLASVAVALVAAVGLSACTIGDTEDASTAAAPKEAPAAAAVIHTSFEDGTVAATPREPIVLDVTDGAFDDVTVTNEEGREVEGEFNAERSQWRTTETLGYNRDYSIEASATNDDGETITDSSSFSTVVPNSTTSASLVTGQGHTVGIAQPVAVRFESAVGDRKAVQDAIEVTTTPAVEGAFYWVSPSEVRWRPAEFWAPGTEVDVDVNIYGTDMGEGLYGAQDANSNFTIGDEVITTIDDNTKTMTTRINGEVVSSSPVSLGKASTPTPNGTYYIGDRYESLIMDSSTFGVPVDSADGYRLSVNWATQMSYSGIYVHAAPWSVEQQGFTNVSNGCINVTDAYAKSFQNSSNRGDVVKVINTVGPTLPGTDGLGDWNIPWETWRAGNADLA